MILNPLYHWSPSERYESIRTHGLVPGSPETICSTIHAVLFASPDPHHAWRLSGGSGIGDPTLTLWDLWLVTVTSGDHIDVPPMFGYHIEEIRLHNRIEPARLWWVGRRTNRLRWDADQSRTDLADLTVLPAPG